MKDKEVVPDGTQTSEEDRFFYNDPVEDIDLGLDGTDDDDKEEESNDDEPDGNSQPEEESAEEKVNEEPDKFKNKTREEIIESYKNLEALSGKQAQTIGELRKQAQPKEEQLPEGGYTIKDIPNIPDNTLDSIIATYEEYLSTPGKSIDDSDNFGDITIQYSKLVAEKTMRIALNKTSGKDIETKNAVTVHEYQNKEAVTEAEYAEMIQYAKTKLSDNGEITKNDLDVAMLKLFPAKYHKALVDKDKKRIADAKTQATPRLTPSGDGTGAPSVKSIKEINKMTDDQLDKYLESLSVEDLKAVKAQLNKR